MNVGPCTLCGRDAPFRFDASGWAIHRCERCDFEFVHPTPSEEAIAAVYAQGYFSQKTGHGYSDYFGAEAAVSAEKARVRMDRLQALGASGSLLDIGCADGRFVAEARARGFSARGVEVSPEARAALPAELRDLVHGTLEQAAAHAPFQVVTMWDVLEHLRDPIGTLRTVGGMLAPRGLFGVVVPVIDNVNARRWPRSWDQYKPPEHLSFFSRRSLRETIERELSAKVVVEASAWERRSRVLSVAAAASGTVARAAQQVEGVLWRALRGAKVVSEDALDDSVLMIARLLDGVVDGERVR